MTDHADTVRGGLERQADATRQIREHDGPVYEAYKARGEAARGAYAAAGRPAAVLGWAGPSPFLAAPWRRERRVVPASPEQVAAWRAWVTERRGTMSG